MENKEKIKIAIEFLLSLYQDESLNVDKALLGTINESLEALEYRNPLAVTHFLTYPCSQNGDSTAFDICPKCGNPLSRSYQEFCAVCGQKLKWISRNKMKEKNPTSSEH